MAENAAEKQPARGRGRPFQPGQSGNPSGKRKGTRHRATMLAERLLDGEAETMTRQIIQKAKNGDMVALRFCLDRILPPRRDRTVRFELPELVSTSDAGRAMAAITTAVARGYLTPSEAGELSRLLEVYVKTIEAVEFDKRLQALERNAHAP
jgi:Family of unknown function (DUF5681)